MKKATALGIFLSILVFQIIGSDIGIRRRAAAFDDGSLDPTFGMGGKVTTDIQGDFDKARAVAIQADGKIVVAGSAQNGTTIDFAIVRYNTNGTLDTSFDGDGRVVTPVLNGDDFANGVAIQPDGKIVAVGSADNAGHNDFAVLRYNTDGTPDLTFDTDGKTTFDLVVPGLSDIATAVAIQPDGKIVVTGFSDNGSDDDFTVIRLTSLGGLDPAFNVVGVSTFPVQSGDDAANAIAIQSDGKIVVAGYTETGNEKDFGAARLTSTGSLDPTFDLDGRVASSVKVGDDIANSVAIQPDGKIVAAGLARDSGPDTDFAAVRYNPNGSLDNSFDSDGRVTATVASPNDVGRSVALQTDGKIIIAGETDNGSNLDFGVVRLNTDGSLDLTFDLDGKAIIDFQNSNDTAYGAAIQADGRIVVVGDSDVLTVHDIGVVRLGTGTGGQPRYVAPGGSDAANDCSLIGSPCATIAHAILSAAAGDAVTIAAGTYTEFGLIVDRDLTFAGAGSATTIIRAASLPNMAADRVFNINNGVTASMSDLTIQNGKAPTGTTGSDCASFPCLPASNGGVGGAGGGILNNGTLTLTSVIMSGNRAGKGGTAGNISCPVGACNDIGGEGGTGGGVYSTGTLTVNSSTFTNNHAGEPGDPAATIGCGSCSSNPGDTGNGGGLSGNTVTVDSSTFSGNSGDDGGAIQQGMTAITITKSTFTENSASNTGGAINCNGVLPSQTCSISGSAIYDNFTSGTQGGTVAFFGLSTKDISNTTITGNESLGDAGGILANAGTVNITFVTIADNIADANNSTTGDGGGIRNEVATVNLKNSIIVDNSDDGGEAPQISGTITSLGYNHVESTTGGTFSPTTGDVIGSEDGLAPLANNGGPTQTRGLFASSQALDQIPNGTNGCGIAPFDIDQRGVARPVNGSCDKGAFEGTLGIAPQEIDVTGLSVSIPDLDTTPSTMDDTDFGATAPTGGTVVHTFTIHNSGTSDLVLSNPIITGANPLDFSVTANPTSPVVPGGTTTFQITFDPTLPGLRTATVNIVNNDLNESPYNFAIQGTGAVPTAARVLLSGRVRLSNGIGISGAVVTVSGGDLEQPLQARTTAFGYYSVTGLTAGQGYVVTAAARRYTFPSKFAHLLEDTSGFDFVADP